MPPWGGICFSLEYYLSVYLIVFLLICSFFLFISEEKKKYIDARYVYFDCIQHRGIPSSQ